MLKNKVFTLNGSNFHGTEALNKCISAIIADGYMVHLVNVNASRYETIKKEFGEKVFYKN